MIPHDEAACTLQVTSQRLRTDIDSSLSINIGTKDRVVRYHNIKLCFYTDTLFVTGATKSSRGNICAHLFVLDKGYVAIYPMQHQQDYFWPSSSLLRMLVPQTFLSVIHTLHKSKQRSKSSVHKLVGHSKSLKLRISGLTGLSFTLALLRRLRERI
jgi:hypothetical protein